MPKRCKFCLGLHLVHSRTPVSRQWWTIRNGQPAAFVGTLAASVRGAPLPVFRKLGKFGSLWILFDISPHRQLMSVRLDRLRLETPLIQVPCPAGFVMSVPTHREHHSQPTEEFADLIAGFRPIGICNTFPAGQLRFVRAMTQV